MMGSYSDDLLCPDFHWLGHGGLHSFSIQAKLGAEWSCLGGIVRCPRGTNLRAEKDGLLKCMKKIIMITSEKMDKVAKAQRQVS